MSDLKEEGKIILNGFGKLAGLFAVASAVAFLSVPSSVATMDQALKYGCKTGGLFILFGTGALSLSKSRYTAKPLFVLGALLATLLSLGMHPARGKMTTSQPAAAATAPAADIVAPE